MLTITIGTHSLRNAMEKIHKVALSKTTVESIKNVCLMASECELKISATNLEQYASTSIYAEVHTTGGFILTETKEALKALKFFKDDTTVISYCKTSQSATFSCGGKSIAISNLISIDEFPAFPALGNITVDAEYDAGRLQARYKAVSYAASTDSGKPVLMGVHMHKNDIVACDGFRIALNKDESLHIAAPLNVPIAAYKYAADIMKDKIRIQSDRKYVQLSDDTSVVISRLFDGEFINYEKILDGLNHYDEVTFDSKEFIENLKFLTTFGENLVRWTKAGDLITVSSNASTKRASTQITSLEGEMPCEIAFNAKFMIEALGQLKAGDIRSQIGTRVSPMVLSSVSCDQNIALVVPCNA